MMVVGRSHRPNPLLIITHQYLFVIFELRAHIDYDIIFTICDLIFNGLAKLSSDDLKKESTDTVGGIIQDIFRLLNLENVNKRMEIFTIWLNIIFNYIFSSSLPQRLFGYEQLISLISKSKQFRKNPDKIAVDCPGNPYVNGIYVISTDRDKTSHTPKYVMINSNTSMLNV